MNFTSINAYRGTYPAIRISLRGLEPMTEYTVSLEVASADDHRYDYIKKAWQAVEKSDVVHNETFKHPGSPNLGSFWMAIPVNFSTHVTFTHKYITIPGYVSQQ